MKITRMILSLLLLTGFGLTLNPSFAEDMDQQCAKFCTDNGFEDGHYLAPDGGECDAEYEKNPDNEVCCCK